MTHGVPIPGQGVEESLQAVVHDADLAVVGGHEIRPLDVRASAVVHEAVEVRRAGGYGACASMYWMIQEVGLRPLRGRRAIS